MNWIYNDGGRFVAGFKGKTGDCLVRSVAIITGEDYRTIYDEVNLWGKGERKTKRRPRQGSARTGIYTWRKYIESKGLVWTPTMGIGTGCQVHLREGELPMGRLIVRVTRHLVAVIDGIIYDTYDCSRGGTRCVYGYFKIEDDDHGKM